MRRGRASWAPLAALSFVVLAGCAGDGIFQPPGLVSPDGQVTFSAIRDDVFRPRCSGCHGGLFELRSNLVGVPSQHPGFQLVTPGNPEDSYVVMKLAGDPRILGNRMPQGGPFLDELTIELIRRWIRAGAPDN